MAHQYVEEVLGNRDGPPHGEPFREACRRLRVAGTTAAAGGRRSRLDASEDGRDQALERIKRLLALAGSPNEHEAASAMRLAHKYLLKYNLDLGEVESARLYETRCLGRPSPRIQEYEYTLGRILEEHFFVAIIWLSTYDPLADRCVRILQASGTPENLDIAAYVHAYVMNLVEPLWRERKLSAGAAGGTRLQYLAGLLRGFEEKLDREKRSLKEERGLVWRGDPGLAAYFDHLHPRTRSVGGWGVARSGLYDAGVQDGRKLTIRRGMKGGPQNRGRLLSGPGV
jgi:hypothetical protein